MRVQNSILYGDKKIKLRNVRFESCEEGVV